MTRRNYYWLTATEPDTGKPYLIYGGVTEEEARQKGLEVLGGLDFDIRSLPTKNLASASEMIHGRRLDETHNLREASRRIGHDRTLRRRNRRIINKRGIW